MNILVIGNTSIVGKRVIDQFKSRSNCFVYTAGRNMEADIYLDLEDENFIGNVEEYKFDVIVHCAASFEDDSIEGCIKNLKINTVGAIRVVDLALKTQCQRVVYLSSISAYSSKNNEFYNSYGMSKKFAGEYFKMLCNQYKIEYLELLPSQIYDEASEQEKHQGLLYFIIKQASKGEEITFFGEVDVKRNFIFIGDLLNIIERVTFSTITGSFPCCYPESYKLSEIATMAYHTFGFSNFYKFDGSKENLKTIYIPEKSCRLYELINYMPQVSLKVGIQLIKQTLGTKG